MARKAASPAPSRSTVPAQPPFARNSIVWEKRAGLPVWAWAGLVLLLVLVIVWWRSRSSSSSSTSSSGVTTTTTSGGSSSTGSNTGTDTGTGTTTTPGSDPGTGDGNTTPPGSGAPPPTTTPAPNPAGGWVTVTKWPDSTWPKEDSLWNIAESWLPEGASNWGLIWNNPQNADIKAKRKDPDLIQAYDKLWVPNKLATNRTS